MTKKVPVMLLWSGEDRQYLWQKEGNAEKRVGLSAQDHLFRLLDEDSSFSFQGQQGHLNLLKETRLRGGNGYWYAYRRQGKRVMKKYAGRPSDLTIARLEELALAMQADTIQSEPSQPSPLSSCSLYAASTGNASHDQIAPIVSNIFPALARANARATG